SCVLLWVYGVDFTEFYLLPNLKDVLWVRNGRQQPTLGYEDITFLVKIHKGASQVTNSTSHS
ncbi:hypothetical protein STEG23_036232, partial [Scotinomys teguina]